MSGWRLEQLTFGSSEGRFHAHSYYDIPVIDAAGRRIAVHRFSLAGRNPAPADVAEVGLVEIDRPGSWTPLGTSRAWSMQQGPLAQWIGDGPQVVWSDREDGRVVARLHDTATGATRTLPAPIYAVHPAGRSGLSLNMVRLDALRPGYGFPAERPDGRPLGPRPEDDGVWRVDLETGAATLILPIADAVDFVLGQFPLFRRLWQRRSAFAYWFNHAKIAPGGERFTVKLRWRVPGGPWHDGMGVSLTAGMGGDDLRLLSDATSHVIWADARRLYFWRKRCVELFEDTAPRGRRLARIAPATLRANVHLRHLPPVPTSEPTRFVTDTPYREEIPLSLIDTARGTVEELAVFRNHRPPRGPFRCDLHPVPDREGRRIVVTSVQDGGRQVYALTQDPSG